MDDWIQEKLTDIKAAFDPEYCHEIERVVRLLEAQFRAGRTLFICGNGGSAADAQHIAAEFVGRFQLDRPGLPAIALATNPASVTAWSNDHEFETLFARQLQTLARSGDILWAISTSGKSENVIRALGTARQKGLITIGMAGHHGGQMRGLVDYPLYVAHQNTACIQEIHLLTYHRICQQVENQLFLGAGVGAKTGANHSNHSHHPVELDLENERVSC